MAFPMHTVGLGLPGWEALRQIGRGELLDVPFAKAGAQVAADLQCVAEDEVEPMHPVPPSAHPPALIRVVVHLRLLTAYGQWDVPG